MDRSAYRFGGVTVAIVLLVRRVEPAWQVAFHRFAEVSTGIAAIERSGGTAVAIQADVSKIADINRIFAVCLERFGRLDIVVANAGVELVGQPVVDFTEEDFDRLFAINAKGTFFTLQKAAKHVADNGRISISGPATQPIRRRGMPCTAAARSPPNI